MEIILGFLLGGALGWLGKGAYDNIQAAADSAKTIAGFAPGVFYAIVAVAVLLLALIAVQVYKIRVKRNNNRNILSSFLLAAAFATGGIFSTPTAEAATFAPYVNSTESGYTYSVNEKDIWVVFNYEGNLGSPDFGKRIEAWRYRTALNNACRPHSVRSDCHPLRADGDSGFQKVLTRCVAIEYDHSGRLTDHIARFLRWSQHDDHSILLGHNFPAEGGRYFRVTFVSYEISKTYYRAGGYNLGYDLPNSHGPGADWNIWTKMYCADPGDPPMAMRIRESGVAVPRVEMIPLTLPEVTVSIRPSRAIAGAVEFKVGNLTELKTKCEAAAASTSGIDSSICSALVYENFVGNALAWEIDADEVAFIETLIRQNSQLVKVETCDSSTPIKETSSCRATTQPDCTGNTPILDGGTCRAARPSDCTGNTPILDNGRCRADDGSGGGGGGGGGGIVNPPNPLERTVFITPSRTVAGVSVFATPILTSLKATCETAAASANGIELSLCAPLVDASIVNNTIAWAIAANQVNFVAALAMQNRPIFGIRSCHPDTPIQLTHSCRAAIQSDCTGATPRLFEGKCAAALPMTVIATPIMTISLTLQSPSSGNCNNDGILGTRPSADGATCECPDGQEVLSDGTRNACTAPLPAPAARFVGTDCVGAGWRWRYNSDPDGRFMQSCLVPCQIAPSAPNSPPVLSSAESALEVGIEPAQLSAGDIVDACVMTRDANFDATAAGVSDIPLCTDPDLFGTHGFPTKPQNFDNTTTGQNRHRLTIAAGTGNAAREVMYNSQIVARAPVASAGGGGGSSGGGGGAGIAIGVAAVVGLLALATWSGDPDAFTFSPDVGINYDSQSGHILRYGTRMDFREKAWHAWWSAAQTNTRNGMGELRYGSGAEYAGEFWNARLQNDGYGKRSDSEFSLSAEKEFGVWSFAPLYRVQYGKDETSESWRHALSVSAVWRVEKWTLTNSAGFYGESLAAFGDNASAKVLLRREF